MSIIEVLERLDRAVTRWFNGFRTTVDWLDNSESGETYDAIAEQEAE